MIHHHDNAHYSRYNKRARTKLTNEDLFNYYNDRNNTIYNKSYESYNICMPLKILSNNDSDIRKI